MNRKDFLTVNETAKLLVLSDETIRRWIRAKKIPAIKFAGRWLIKKQVYISFLRGLDKFCNGVKDGK